MKMTLGGAFENAFIRGIALQHGPAALNLHHPYYASLERETPAAYFDRCATFSVVAQNLVLPAVDWTPAQGGEMEGYSDELFGIERYDPPHYYDRHGDDIGAFCEIALVNRAFSDSTVRLLTEGVASEARKNRESVRIIKGVSVDTFAIDKLRRILLQVECAAAVKSVLVLSQNERNIIAELGAFLERHQIPAPIDIPNISKLSLSDGENFAGGLLNFSPPDALSIVAVRSNEEIQIYAAKVREILSKSADFDSRRALVLAMREALEKSEAARKVDKVFEVEKFVAKPLHYIPGLDAVLTVVEDGMDLGKKWLDRDRSQNEWFLLGAKMTDVSLRDYLKRTDNL